MVVRNQCPFCGNVTDKNLDVTKEQLVRYYNREDLIQNIFPNLSPDEREFIMTGYCDSCQEKIFGEEE